MMIQPWEVYLVAVLYFIIGFIIARALKKD